MSSNLARYSAILSALLALGGVATWLIQGAPDVGSLPPAWMTIAGMLSLSIHGSVPLLTHSMLFILAASAAGAALLALVTLLRGSRLGYIHHLGTGLGWWSLGFFFLLMAPAVPTITALRLPLPLLVAGDVLAFMLMMGAGLALQRFWISYPRQISLEELHAFILAKVKQNYLDLPTWRSRLYRLVLRDRAPAVMQSRIDDFGRMNRALLRSTLWPGRGAQAGLLAVAVAGGLLWRLVGILPKDMGDALFVAPFLIFGALLFLPGAHCMNILRMHRAHGTEGERRQIEWIWASFWIAIVLCMTIEVLSLLVVLDMLLFDAFGLDPSLALGVISLMVLVPLFAPLCVLVALSLSIFYRGSLDPRLALRGVTLWTVLGVLLTLVFTLVERSVAVKLSTLMGLPPQTGYVAAGAIVAATFQPIRKRTEKQVNRFVERVLPVAARTQVKPERPARQRRKRPARLRRSAS
jgi:hypothetical protein